MNAKIYFMMRTGFIVAFGMLLVIGTALSIRDYRVWRYEETKNFGHGPGGDVPAVSLPDLVQVYKNDVLQVRLRIPEQWAVKENSLFQITDPKNPPVLEKLLAFERQIEVARFGDRVILSIVKSKSDLPDFVSKQAGELKDRMYVSSSKVTFTLVQFPNRIVAYYGRNGYVFVVSWEGVNDGTFEAILKTAVIS